MQTQILQEWFDLNFVNFWLHAGAICLNVGFFSIDSPVLREWLLWVDYVNMWLMASIAGITFIVLFAAEGFFFEFGKLFWLINIIVLLGFVIFLPFRYGTAARSVKTTREKLAALQVPKGFFVFFILLNYTCIDIFAKLIISQMFAR